jgi:hypothetical protein
MNKMQVLFRKKKRRDAPPDAPSSSVAVRRGSFIRLFIFTRVKVQPRRMVNDFGAEPLRTSLTRSKI